MYCLVDVLGDLEVLRCVVWYKLSKFLGWAVIVRAALRVECFIPGGRDPGTH